jgi:hypothetical protein
VDRGDRAVVARVHGLEHVEGLAATNLTDDDAVGSHTQSVSHQVADPHLALAFDVRRTRFEWEHVLLVELELFRVLDGDDALVVRNEAREHVEQRGLAGTGTTAHHRIEPTFHALVDEVRDLWREDEVDEVVDRVRVLENFRIVMNGPPMASEGARPRHTGAVGKAGVHHRVRLVDAAADLASRSCR